MMQRLIYAAALLLVVQVGLVVTFNRGGNSLEAVTPDTLFAQFTPDEITGIEIADKDNQRLLLQKDSNAWQIESAFSAPADSEVIDDLLSKIAEAKQGFAVATSSGAAGRFKTAKDDFERHILIKKGDQIVADFYLGTSAGMRKSHARKTSETEVFTLPVSSFEVEAAPDKWLDKSVVQLKKEQLKTIKIADIELKKEESGWQIVGTDPKEVNTEEIDKLVKAITDIKVESVLDAANVKSLFDKGPELQFVVSTDTKKDVQYSFAKQDDYQVLKTTDSDLYFKVYSWQVENLQGFNKEKLVKPEEIVEHAENTQVNG